MEKRTKQHINNLLNKNFKWFVLLVVMGAFIWGHFFIVEPQFKDTIRSFRTHLSLERQNYVSKKKELEKVKSIMSVYNRMEQEKKDRLNTFLPSRYSYERLFTELDSLVSANGILSSRITINVPEEQRKEEEREDEGGGDVTEIKEDEEIERNIPPAVKTAKAEIEMMGVSYSALRSLVSDLENNLRLMDVVRVHFNPKDNTGSLILWTYYFDEDNFDPERDTQL